MSGKINHLRLKGRNPGLESMLQRFLCLLRCGCTMCFNKPSCPGGMRAGIYISLRHTYASLLIVDGTLLVVVSKNLGHAQTSTTGDIYSHVIASAEAKATQVTDKFAEDIHPKFTPKAKKESAS